LFLVVHFFIIFLIFDVLLGGWFGNRAKGAVEGVTQAWARREMNMKGRFPPFIPVFMSYKIQDIQACQI
jgi:hypothetical protein